MSRFDRWSLIQDVDGCLANFNSPFLQLLKDLHGPPPKGDPKLEKWHWPSEECGYTKTQIDAAWDEVDDNFWRNLEPLPGAVKALDRMWWMEQEGMITPYFVTGRLPWAREATIRWIEEYGGFRFPQVICTSGKDFVALALHQNGLIAAVEDKPSILKRYGPSGVQIARIYAPSYAYNQGIEGVEYVTDAFEAIVDLEEVINPKKEAPADAEAEAV